MFTRRHPRDKGSRCKRCGKIDQATFTPMFSRAALEDVAKSMGVEIKPRKKNKRRKTKKEKS